VKNAVFWDDTPCDSCKSRHFSELGITLAITSNRRTLRNLVSLLMEARCSSETSVLTRATSDIPEDGILCVCFHTKSFNGSEISILHACSHQLRTCPDDGLSKLLSEWRRRGKGRSSCCLNKPTERLVRQRLSLDLCNGL
jgi:hypothetical protein